MTSSGAKKPQKNNINYEDTKISYISPKSIPNSSVKFSIERLYFSPRKNTLTKKVVVIQFDGIIGEFLFSMQDQTQSLNLKPNSYQMINSISKKMHVVILFRSTKSKAEFSLDQLLKLGVTFDAGYFINKGLWNQLPISYEQIYKDFGINNDDIRNNLVIVGSYDSEIFSLDQNLNEVFSSVPIIFNNDYYKKTPIIILLKNSRLWNKQFVSPLFAL